MNNLRAAAEKALAALEDASGRLSLEFTGHLVYRDEISDLRTALAQPEKTCCCDDPNVPEVNNHD